MPVVEINTSCNPVWVTIPDGAVETLAATYAAGAAAVDQTMLINAADGGPVIFQANAAATGSLVQAQTSTGTVLFNITDNAAITIAPTTALTLTAAAASTWSTTAGALTITSAAALTLTAAAASTWSTSAGALTITSAAALTLTGAAASTWSTSAGALTITSAAAATWSTSAGALTLQGAAGAIIGDAVASVKSAANGFSDPSLASTATPTSRISFGTNVYVNAGGGSFNPETDLVTTNGASTRRWTETWSRRYATVEKVVTFSATPAFTPADGDYQQITLTANITSWTIGAGLAGEIITLEFIQDATGNRTLSGTPGNVLLAGGAFVLTVTANKRDTLTLRYNTTAAAWVEISRAQNL